MRCTGRTPLDTNLVQQVQKYFFVNARTKTVRESELQKYYLGHITYRHTCHVIRSHKGEDPALHSV